MAIKDAARRLNKEFGNDSLLIKADLQPKYERISSGALGFDFPLFGGAPEGRVIQFSGMEGSGKTTAACMLMSAYQRKYPEKTCVFVDVEHALDLQYTASMTGIDWTKIYYMNPEGMSGEQILDATHELIQEDDCGMVILDSAAALVSGREYENDVDKDSGIGGTIAKSLNRFLKKALDKIKGQKSLLIINQTRVVGKTPVGATIYAEPCGSGLAFYSSLILRFGKRSFTEGDKVDKFDGEKADGIRLKFAIQKQKTAPVSRGGGFITFRYATGLDWVFDLFEVALKYEFIKRPTTQSYLIYDLVNDRPYKDAAGNDLIVKGRDNVKAYFAENPVFQKEYLNMLTTHIQAVSNQYGKLLDDREILEEAASVTKDFKEELEPAE